MKSGGYKIGDTVRLYEYPGNSANAYAKIMDISSTGRIWLSNLKKDWKYDIMPFDGTISMICSKKQFEKMIKKKL